MGFAPALFAIGSVISAGAAIEGGIARGQEANYQAQVARNNAQIARNNALSATRAGEQQAAASSMKGAANLARIKVAQAASGIDIDSGSAVDVQAGEAQTNRLDTLTVMNNAALKAYGYQSEAGTQEAQAGLYAGEGSEAPIGATIGAVGGLLSSASSIPSKFGGGSGSSGAAAADADSSEYEGG